VVLLTNDNPRNEDPARIIADIQSGMGRVGAIVQPDRAQAIEQALQLAKPNDIVLIAGKGHEDYQIIGGETRHFSDREVVSELLRRTA
jgi:UDP-N-acetylmuramoyl-L-alanyl-D-glutamate--2,6-diaminopimelate ligase